MPAFFSSKARHGIIIAEITVKYVFTAGEPYTMKADTNIPWNGVERRKKERRCEEIKKCISCEGMFAVRGVLNICPDCIDKIILHHKKEEYLHIKT